MNAAPTETTVTAMPSVPTLRAASLAHVSQTSPEMGSAVRKLDLVAASRVIPMHYVNCARTHHSVYVVQASQGMA